MKLDNLKQLIKEELNRTLNENVRNNKDIKAGEYEITYEPMIGEPKTITVKVEVYNQLRALAGVVVITVEQNEYLDSKATDKFEYSLLHIKYLVTADPKTDINRIKKDALVTTRIPGLLQFIPRYTTTQNLGKY